MMKHFCSDRCGLFLDDGNVLTTVHEGSLNGIRLKIIVTSDVVMAIPALYSESDNSAQLTNNREPFGEYELGYFLSLKIDMQINESLYNMKLFVYYI